MKKFDRLMYRNRIDTILYLMYLVYGDLKYMVDNENLPKFYIDWYKDILDDLYAYMEHYFYYSKPTKVENTK